MKHNTLDYPIELHYSQTLNSCDSRNVWLDYPIELHYSQTPNPRKRHYTPYNSIEYIVEFKKT